MDKNIIFASLALEMGILTESQVRQGLILLGDAPDASLSDICINEGWVTPQDIIIVESKIQLSRQEQEANVTSSPNLESRHDPLLAEGDASLPEILEKVEKLQHRPTQPIDSESELSATVFSSHTSKMDMMGSASSRQGDPSTFIDDNPMNSNWLEKSSDDPLLDYEIKIDGNTGEGSAFSSGRHPGEQLGQYQLLEEVAQGGTGTIFKAREINTKRIVAIKVMHQGDLLDERQVERFHREVEAAGKLEHPYIVPIYDSGGTKDTHYMAMEFIEGEPLSQYYKKHKLGPIGAARLMAKVAIAIEHAHSRQIIHRDLKPANILIDHEGEPHITDFGVAKDLTRHSHHLTQSGTTVGTPFYMSPEQVMGDSEAIGPETDVYALGVILYELLTEKIPFRGDSVDDIYQEILRADPLMPRSIQPAIPPNLEAITLKAMAKNAQWRYGTAREMAEDIERFLAGKSILAHPATSMVRVFRTLWPYRFYITLGSVLFICIILALLVILPGERELSPELRKQRILEKQLQSLQDIYQQAKHERLVELARELAKAYPDTPQIHYHLAQGLAAQKKYKEAQQSYIKVYWLSPEVPLIQNAMLGMATCSLQLGEHKKAQEIMATLVERYPTISNSPVFSLLYGKILINGGEFPKARHYLEQISPQSLAKADAEELQYYLSWLGMLSPEKKISFVADDAKVVRLASDTTAIIAWNNEICHAYNLRSGNFSHIGTLRKPENMEFTGPLVVANLYGDYEQIILAARANDSSYLLFYRYKNNQFIRERRVRMKMKVKTIAVGRFTTQEKDNLLIVDALKNECKLLLYSEKHKKIRALSVFPGTSDILSIAVVEVDGDQQQELLIGTGDWQRYDVGIYDFSIKKRRFIVRSNRQIGKVTGCQAADLDKNGIVEIIATKTHTHNNDVFGKERPHGDADGIYFFQAREQLELLWKYTVEGDSTHKNEITDLQIGLLGDTAIAICTHNQIKKGFHGDREKQSIWCIRSYRGEFKRLDFSSPGIFSYSLGDVDGDEKGEFIICRQNGISIYGVEDH